MKNPILTALNEERRTEAKKLRLIDGLIARMAKAGIGGVKRRKSKKAGTGRRSTKVQRQRTAATDAPGVVKDQPPTKKEAAAKRKRAAELKAKRGRQETAGTAGTRENE